MNETSKNHLTTYFQEADSLIILDSSALTNNGTESFFSYLNELNDADVSEIGAVIPVKTFETLKKLIADKKQDYQMRKHASDSVMRIAELIGTNRIKVFGDDSDKMDENTVILTQLARLRTSYDILLLSNNPDLLRDAELINAFTSTKGRPAMLSSLDDDGEIVLHQSLIHLSDIEACEESKKETIQKFTEASEEATVRDNVDEPEEDNVWNFVREEAVEEAAFAGHVVSTAEQDEIADAPSESPKTNISAMEQEPSKVEQTDSDKLLYEPLTSPLKSAFIPLNDLEAPDTALPSADGDFQAELSSEETEPDSTADLSAGWYNWNAAEVAIPKNSEEITSENEAMDLLPTDMSAEIEEPKKPHSSSAGMFSFLRKLRHHPESHHKSDSIKEDAEVPQSVSIADVRIAQADEIALNTEPKPVQPFAQIEESALTPHEESVGETQDDATDLVYCINCGRKVPADETIEEVCEDCLNQVVGEARCINCGKPVPVLFRNRFIDQNEDGLVCEECQTHSPQESDMIFTKHTVPVPEEEPAEEVLAAGADEPDMVYCINCGRKVPAEETVEEVCQECLESIVDVKTCAGCGTVIPITFRDRYIDQTEERLFCDRCMEENAEKPESMSPIEETDAQDDWSKLGTDLAPAPQSAQESSEDIQPESAETRNERQTVIHPKLAPCQKCGRLIPEEELIEGYCEDCLNEVDHYTFCIECGTKIPVTFREQYIDHAEQRYYCDACVQKLGLSLATEEETEEALLIECAHCHQMVPEDQTDNGYCNNCLGQVVDQSYCIECGAPIPVTFKEFYVDKSPRRLYCDNCQPADSDTDHQNNGPDLSGWSVL